MSPGFLAHATLWMDGWWCCCEVQSPADKEQIQDGRGFGIIIMLPLKKV